MNKPQIISELSRLENSLHQTQSAHLVSFHILCPSGPSSVLENVKSVLSVVLTHSINQWPSDDEWTRLLPAWFLSVCAPEQSPQEAERWLNWWRQLSPSDQQAAEMNKEWSLLNWLYWMNPKNRQWAWWEAQIPIDQATILLFVQSDDLPFAWGALRWLFRASGAARIEMVE